jgi:hypothetical protein
MTLGRRRTGLCPADRREPGVFQHGLSAIASCRRWPTWPGLSGPWLQSPGAMTRRCRQKRFPTPGKPIRRAGIRERNGPASHPGSPAAHPGSFAGGHSEACCPNSGSECSFRNRILIRDENHEAAADASGRCGFVAAGETRIGKERTVELSRNQPRSRIAEEFGRPSTDSLVLIRRILAVRRTYSLNRAPRSSKMHGVAVTGASQPT